MNLDQHKINIQKQVRPYLGAFDEVITFGVEIEFIAPLSVFPAGTMRRSMSNMTNREDLAEKLQEMTGFSFVARNHYGSEYDYWQIKYDGSVHAYDRNYIGGFELVSPILHGKKGLAALFKVAETLKNLNCKTNRSCGTHVHFGIGSFFEGFESENPNPTASREKLRYVAKTIADTYLEYESVIDSFVLQSRNRNNYCRSLKTDLESCISYSLHKREGKDEGSYFDNLSDYHDDGKISSFQVFRSRYDKVNLTNLPRDRHQTVEIRQLQGTFNMILIADWIFLHQRMIHRALCRDLDGRKRCRNFDELVNYLQWDEEFENEEIKFTKKRFRTLYNRRNPVRRIRRDQPESLQQIIIDTYHVN